MAYLPIGKEGEADLKDGVEADHVGGLGEAKE